MIGMCRIFLFCAIFYFVGANDYQEAYDRASKKCASEIGVDQESLRILIRRSRNNPDRRYKCFLKCFMQEFGSMDNEGNILDRLDYYELPYQYAAIRNECVKEVSTEKDICERAFSFHECFMEKARDIKEEDYYNN